MLNPYIKKIKGDLSRADVVALVLLCRNKEVVEFGIGGSTYLLSQVAKKLTCFDTDDMWIERVTNNLKSIENKTCEPVIHKIEKEADIKIPVSPCDVLFDDGWSVLRDKFLLAYWPHIKECAILHDGRMTYAGPIWVEIST